MQRHYGILTSITLVVSLPKISTTLTAILRRPLEASFSAEISSSFLSFFVLNDCHSFSKIYPPVHFSSNPPLEKGGKGGGQTGNIVYKIDRVHSLHIIQIGRAS